MPCFVGVVLSQTDVVAVDDADTLDEPEVSVFIDWAAIVDSDRGTLGLHRRIASLMLCSKGLFSSLITLFFDVYVALLL